MKCESCLQLKRAQRAMAGVAPYFLVSYCPLKENLIVDPEVDRFCDLYTKGEPNGIDRAG